MNITNHISISSCRVSILQLSLLVLTAINPSFKSCLTGVAQASPVKSPTGIRSHYAAGEITRLCANNIENAAVIFNQIGKLSPEKRTFDNTLLAYETAFADLSDATTPLTFMSYVSTDDQSNQEGTACKEKFQQFAVATFTRRDLYEAILQNQQNLRDQKARSPEEERLLSETLKTFEENGLKLSDEKLSEFKKLKQDLLLHETQFLANLNRDQSSVEFSAEELTGLSADFIKSLKHSRKQLADKSDSRYLVTTKGPDVIQVSENATHDETRRKIIDAYENRAGEINVKLLEEALTLREKIADLLGFSSWAEYRAHYRMAKDAKSVMKFLNDLRDKLSSRNKEDLALLLKFKQELDPDAKDLAIWDVRYLSYQYRKKNFNLDDDEIRPYFPVDVVIAGVFKVYSQLLGIELIQEKGAKTWAEHVHLYQVRDPKTHQVIARFYLDLFPRPLKFGHAGAAITLIRGRKMGDGSYRQPISAIVANFNGPENGKPALLKHDDVKTFFHEFGHLMHHTLTRAPYASLSGSAVDRSFVEAPSQMLENWVFAPEILEMISGHYLDHRRKLPPALLEKIIAARDFNQGFFYTRQLLFALLDMNYHMSSDPVDTVSVYRQLHKELISLPTIETTHFPGGFQHMVTGYDAGYYGYLWSEVYAQDMFTRFRTAGLLDPALGMQYRKLILERGNMVDAIDILREFLGRDPNTEAFFKKLRVQ